MAQTVLVVDDNELIRVLASRVLAEAGFVPFSAPDGPSALLLLDAHAFDLIVVDFVMPEMSGDEFIRRVRSHKKPAVRLTPVLGLSGSHEDAETLLTTAGASGYVRKPLQDERLLAAVRRLLEPAGEKKERRVHGA
jgi:two-component system, chemotaxis family, chemotaxis protein CheY